ncbi:hypothetical protein ISF_03661 [Cordyceps fumosorosea ARSEF 2679]|uniref:Uncharacterized protein n=1 Tax=Cordyceps fumosorosea (strain ARSEF 2679) TaxID=1081104 RepID=A0A167ZGF4_CORFA|nr:hypothetical protein ISF_03661 [Cordyceps fumosorosea ARSEF 2679]OAA67485.1 hypothetical protein ISF_03661 [Cordyceps fumosorosea ARSEF 2679]
MHSEPPRRRFAPEPIETTYKSHRTAPPPAQGIRVGPNPELTPEPSPRSLSPASAYPRIRRRFAPQLIETSRRSHRVGDPGPATRPTDKTDITPYTNHIYTAKARSKKRHDGVIAEEETLHRKQPTRRETEEEEVKEYLLELAAKEAERQIQEDALAAFPNSHAREGGVAHFYFRDGSSSEESPGMSPAEDERGRRRLRRKTSSLDLNWWQRHMQEHAEKLAYEREDAEEEINRFEDMDMTSDSELDKMDLTVPPDAMWTTSRRASLGDSRDSASEQAEARKWAAAKESEALHVLRGPAPESTTIHDQSQLRAQHHLQHQPLQKQHEQQQAPPQQHQQPANASAIRRQHDPFGRPFAALGIRPDAAHLQRIRKFVSPPMLGKELNFRKCPSPKQTKLETDHSFVLSQNAKQDRDLSGKGGLWRGYCCRSESTGGYLVPAELHPPAMMATPRTPGTPKELFVHEVDCVLAVTDEPAHLWDAAAAAESAGASGNGSLPGTCAPAPAPGTAERRLRSGAPKGLHMLHGLDERLQQEKARAERDDKIALEFGDEFVTQVYNYLSLGYPAMARSFDEELAKISRVSVAELCRDDDQQLAKGHMLEMRLDDETPEEARCPRWRALRVYILEWARQHPDLDNLNPLAWGVHERRGSWAI